MLWWPWELRSDSLWGNFHLKRGVAKPSRVKGTSSRRRRDEGPRLAILDLNPGLEFFKSESRQSVWLLAFFMLRILTGMFLRFLELDLDLVLRTEVFPHCFCEVTQAIHPHFTTERTGGTGGTEMLVNKGAEWTLGGWGSQPR